MPNDAKVVITAEDRASAVFRTLAGNVRGVEGAFERVNAPLARFQHILAAVGTGAVAAGFRALVTSIDDLDESAQALGLTAVALSEMQTSARLVGVEAEALGGAMTRLNVKISEAADGNREASALFRRLGIDIRDQHGAVRSTDAVLADLAHTFSQFPEGPQKAALAVEVFGRASARLLPYLNQGAEGLRTFSGLTDETVREAVRLQTEFDKLAVSAERFKNAIAGAVVPATNTFIDTVRRLDFKRLFAATFELGRGPSLAVNFTRELTRQLGDAAAARDLYNRAVEEGIKLDAADRVGGGTRAIPRPERAAAAATAPKEEIDASATALAQFVEQLQRQRDTLEDISRTEEALRFFRAHPSIDTPAVRELVLSQIELVDALEAEKRSREELARLTREEQAAAAALDAQLDDFSGRAAAVRKDLLNARLEARLLAGEAFTEEEFEATIRGINGVKDAIEDARDASDRFALVLTSSLGNLFDQQGASARDFFDALIADVGKLITQLLILEPLQKSIAESFKAGKAGGGGFSFSALLSSLGSALVGRFATGTDFVPRTGLALVHQGERIVPAAQNRRGMRNHVVNVNLPAGANVTRQTAAQIGAAVSRQLTLSDARNN